MTLPTDRRADRSARGSLVSNASTSTPTRAGLRINEMDGERSLLDQFTAFGCYCLHAQ